MDMACKTNTMTTTNKVDTRAEETLDQTRTKIIKESNTTKADIRVEAIIRIGAMTRDTKVTIIRIRGAIRLIIEVEITRKSPEVKILKTRHLLSPP